MKTSISLILLALLGFYGCKRDQNSDEVQNSGQEQLSMMAVRSVGVPAIVNFQEKRTLKTIYELRDQKIVTITYTQDMNGKLHKMCDSIGYGIPAAAQFTNPAKIDCRYSNGGCVAIPQSEPNGLYTPSTAEGTWVLCKNPNGTDVSPVYSEPRIIVAPFPLTSN